MNNAKGRDLRSIKNKGKTETMIVMKHSLPLNANILLDGQRIRNTDDYIYLGSKIANNGRNETEIVRRIGMAKRRR